MILSAGQKQVMSDLRCVAELAMSMDRYHHLPIQPRTHSLLCGPSGVGKSHICRVLGKELGVEVMVVNCSSWQPNGSRSEVHTWTAIAKFLNDHSRGIIVLDEVDKISGSSEWQGYIRLEIHDLLDGVIPPHIDLPPKKLSRLEAIEAKKKEEEDFWGPSSDDCESWGSSSNQVEREELAEKLRNHYFIVGAGAWQHFWELSGKSEIGFKQSTSSSLSTPTEEQIKTSIYPEILKRFRSGMLIISPMNECDYRAVAKAMASSLTPAQASRFHHQYYTGIERALNSQFGMRWFEDLLLDALTHPAELALEYKNYASNT